MKNTDKMIKKEKWPKAEFITVKQLKNFIDTPGDRRVYRQSMNWSMTHWDCAKARLATGRWKKINNEDTIFNEKQNGKNKRRFLMWRLRLWLIDNAVDTMNRPLWAMEVKKLRHTAKRNGKKTLYTTFYLLCRRINYGIQGVM
ncbi:hypothetical protein LCGC14_0815550 [marine sediment metagenome]|uniref:Uncharacterized protein n=1 Tax=marine sediment metagenome TaxID=412755 RepID=A0A0F9PKF5_9ZZZZ